MPNRIRKRKKLIAPKGSSREKGDIVERIVADMHEEYGVKVEQNVFLAAQDGGGRTREIDVLLSSEVAGYPIRVAIECKNEKGRVGIDEMDEYIGKLGDVGIPTQNSVFVSASGYTSDAILRAQKVGIKTAVLRDATDSLPQQIRKAFQSIIYLLLTITNIQVQSDAEGPVLAGEMLFFRNQDGRVCGAIPDLVWHEWRSGNISDQLGNQQIEVTIPSEWLHIVNGQVLRLPKVKVDVQITGHMVSFPGSVSRHLLVNASDQKVAKWQIQAKFERPQGTYSVQSFLTEEEFQKIPKQESGIEVIVTRMRLPRIRWGPLYWPPSGGAVDRLVALTRQALAEGRTLDLSSMDLAALEGTDLRKVWEPIWKEHPSAKKPSD